jgi:lipase ATG15
MAAARQHGFAPVLPPSAWSVDRVLAPNISDKATVLALARMAIDAYYINDTCAGWDDVGGPINRTDDFGWEGDGLRGHVFVDQENSTVVVSIKGTSRGWSHIFTCTYEIF